MRGEEKRRKVNDFHLEASTESVRTSSSDSSPDCTGRASKVVFEAIVVRATEAMKLRKGIEQRYLWGITNVHTVPRKKYNS